jgi:hypothetical protein
MRSPKSLIVASVAGLTIASLAQVASAGGLIYVGPGGGAARPTKTFAIPGANEVGSFFAYDPAFTGGVRVAAGDLTGDGYPDLITGTGGGGPHVKVFSGTDGAQVRSFFPYPGFTGGVYVAAGDVNGDRRPDIVTGTDVGGGGHVRVFDGVTNGDVRSFNPYGSGFAGGVTVAAGDVNGDSFIDIITAPSGGSNAAPNVRVFSGADNSQLFNFFATTPSFTGGVFVASGDVNGDGRDDIIAGLDGGGLVNIFSGVNLEPLGSFQPYGAGFTGGVRVATGDVNGDGFDDIITGAGGSPGGHVKVFNGAGLGEVASFFAFDPNFTGGVYVGAAAVPEPAAVGAVVASAAMFMTRRSTARRRGG